MDWYIEKTTAHERVEILTAVYGLFEPLDWADTLLDTVIEEFFSDRKQQPISAGSAEWIRCLLCTARDIVSETTLSFNLLTANTEDPRVESYLKAADRVRAALKCDSMCDKVSNLEHTLPAERRASVQNARLEIMNLEDTVAIPALESLLTRQPK